MTIGERIKQRREELGISQEELAKRIGYTSRSTINKIEKNENNLRQSKILEIANALSTTPSYIMGWEDIKVPNGEISISDVAISIKFWSADDRNYYLKMAKLVSNPDKRKIICKFIDSLIDD